MNGIPKKHTLDRRIAIGVFLTTIALCGMSSGSHVYVTDGAAMYFMSCSILDHGWFDVELHPNTRGGKYGPDGQYYMPFGFLQPVLGIPFLLAGRRLESVFEARYLPFFSITWLNWLACGFLSSIFYSICRQYSLHRRPALLLAFAVVFSTPLWVYSQTFFAEPLTALLTLLSWHYVTRAHSESSRSLLALGGAIAGAVTWIRPLGGIVIPALALYCLLLEKSKPGTPGSRRTLLDLCAFSLPAAGGIGIYLLYNFVRFGSIMETGYDKLPSGMPRSFTLDWQTGLKILLLSPGKSVFVFAPLMLLVPLGAYIWLKSKTTLPEAVFCLSTGCLYLAVLSRWARVEGGVAWGPRLFLPAIPVLFLCLIPLLTGKNKRPVLPIIILALLGFMVQIPGAFVNFSTYIHRNPDSYYNPLDGSYQLDFNPIPAHLTELAHLLAQIPDMQQRQPDEAKFYRGLEQINPDGLIDTWWIFMWLDRISTVMIAGILCILSLFLFSGVCLISCAVKHGESG